MPKEQSKRFWRIITDMLKIKMLGKGHTICVEEEVKQLQKNNREMDQ